MGFHPDGVLTVRAIPAEYRPLVHHRDSALAVRRGVIGEPFPYQVPARSRDIGKRQRLRCLNL